MRKSSLLKMASIGVLSLSLMAGCSNASTASDAKKDTGSSKVSLEELTKSAKAEGVVTSVGMPDSWANWKGTWDDLLTKYTIKHTDTDM
jgi:putative spermidine/putrescine transport system substrate-binding protein